MKSKATGNRAQMAQMRRDAILDAAFVEFKEHGYAGTRLDDVARRAGVAKGTIYLNFADKETLFEQMVKSVLKPSMAEVDQSIASGPATSARQIIEKAVIPSFASFICSKGGDVMRLCITEGMRFPRVAEFYYSEIVAPLRANQLTLLKRAAQEGSLRCCAVIDFPELLEAPLMLANVWQGLFAGLAPLDYEGMLRAHYDCLLLPQTGDNG